MNILRILQTKRMVLCFVLLGTLSLAGGCGPDYTTQREATAEQKARMDKMQGTMKEARAKAIQEARTAGKRQGRPEKQEKQEKQEKPEEKKS